MTRDISHIPIVRSDDPSGSGLPIVRLVAYVGGEPASDQPWCVSPLLWKFVEVWADQLGYDDRQQLRPYIASLARSRGADAIEARRRWLVVDWLMRTVVPVWLRHAAVGEVAEGLCSLPEITGPNELADARDAADAAADAAYQVAGRVWIGVSERLHRAEATDVEALSGVTATAQEQTVTMVRPCGLATGYAVMPAPNVPEAWRSAIFATGQALRAIAWSAVLEVIGDSSWSWGRDVDEIWQTIRPAARSALRPGEVELQDAAHALLGDLLGVR